MTYDRKGNLNLLARYAHGQKDGTWYYHTSAHRVLRVEIYRNGKLIAKKDSTQLNQESEKWLDSTKNRPITVEIESQFPGGPAAWGQYLNQNMRYPDHAVKATIQGSPIVAFVVGKDGKVEQDQIYLDKSAEYYLDEEALRVIRISPDWIPATQGGKQVRSWKKQPIDFKLEIQKPAEQPPKH
ncbi:TonB family protein [Puia sp. P3]|uniref:energy transducer TonB n=1 Tax=Puia sp. P3 TaxID=3423952 RepID=UPI003D67D0F0